MASKFEHYAKPVTAGSVLGVLGIVYGDIGTSPLYAFKECFQGPNSIHASRDTIFGVLSLVFWALILIVSIKYLLVVLRADNRGEGGVLALMALVSQTDHRGTILKMSLMTVGVLGASLLYADAMITPAISVLSAVEGIEKLDPDLEPWILPGAACILIGIFVLQHFGTERIGGIFGPVMSVWFSVLALMGIGAISTNPGVLWAIGPWHAVSFFAENGWTAFAVMGTVFLVVTGGEALYADMGHFGKGPIQAGWFTVVLPALLLNYFGQGALLLNEDQAVKHLFLDMAPAWATLPLIGLSTLATIIASQAVISGAFSLACQAMQLGYLPRFVIEQTSLREKGQVYVPIINWGLMLCTLAILFHFQKSGNLAAAYGVAVSTTMLITSVLLFFIMLRLWKWPWYATVPLTILFVCVDFCFFTANLAKVELGGWIPLVIAGILFSIMATWRRGRKVLSEILEPCQMQTARFLESLAIEPAHRVEGTAVFLTENPHTVPAALLHNLKHNKVLHEQVILMSLKTDPVPRVLRSERLEGESLGQGFWTVVMHSGFAERPNMPKILGQVDLPGLELDPMSTTYFIGSIHLKVNPHDKGKMMPWRRLLFAFLHRNAASPEGYFHIPPNRVIELGSQMEF